MGHEVKVCSPYVLIVSALRQPTAREVREDPKFVVKATASTVSAALAVGVRHHASWDTASDDPACLAAGVNKLLNKALRTERTINNPPRCPEGWRRSFCVRIAAEVAQCRTCRSGIEAVSVGRSRGLRLATNKARVGPVVASASAQSTGKSGCQGCVVVQ